MALGGVNHLTFSVPDVDDAVRFYADVLGCRLVARWPAGAYLVAGHAWLALVEGPAESRPDDDYSHIAFDVAPHDFPAIAERIAAAGCETWQDNRTEGDSVYFRDPAGRRLEVHATSLAARIEHARAAPWDGLVIAPDAAALAVEPPTLSDPVKARRFACAPVGVFVMVVDSEDRFLLLRAPDRPTFEVPSGAVEAGEDLEQAARRELAEETGAVQVGPLSCIHAYTVPYHPRLPPLVSVGFVARLQSGTVVPGDDMAGGEVRWAGVPEVESGEVRVSVPTDTALFARALAVVDVAGDG